MVQQVANQVSDLNRSWLSKLTIANHERLTSLNLQGKSYARTSENGSLPLIHRSIITLPLVLITRVPHRGALMGMPSQLGKRLGLCYGFTENVRVLSPSGSYLPLTNPGLIAGSGKSILWSVTSH